MIVEIIKDFHACFISTIVCQHVVEPWCSSAFMVNRMVCGLFVIFTHYSMKYIFSFIVTFTHFHDAELQWTDQEDIACCESL